MWTSDSWSLSACVASFGASPDFAGFSAFFFCAFSISSGVVELRNAMRSLSGDQTGLAAPLGRGLPFAGGVLDAGAGVVCAEVDKQRPRNAKPTKKKEAGFMTSRKVEEWRY